MTAISEAEAARAFEPCAGLDPEGLDTPQSAAQAGQCLRLQTDRGQIVLSVGPKDGALWCYAAAGTGQGMTAAGLKGLECIARAAGFNAVAFQTMRRGLVRQARALGYEITGAIGAGYKMKKAIQ